MQLKKLIKSKKVVVIFLGLFAITFISASILLTPSLKTRLENEISKTGLTIQVLSITKLPSVPLLSSTLSNSTKTINKLANTSNINTNDNINLIVYRNTKTNEQRGVIRIRNE